MILVILIVCWIGTLLLMCWLAGQCYKEGFEAGKKEMRERWTSGTSSFDTSFANSTTDHPVDFKIPEGYSWNTKDILPEPPLFPDLKEEPWKKGPTCPVCEVPLERGKKKNIFGCHECGYQEHPGATRYHCSNPECGLLGAMPPSGKCQGCGTLLSTNFAKVSNK